ncbi:MAG: sulfatase-like hydrolase/transferase [Firmicutes bacterium]|nr:sulfatase-like hydrolase/transferase [Bacillota bacterium]
MLKYYRNKFIISVLFVVAAVAIEIITFNFININSRLVFGIFSLPTYLGITAIYLFCIAVFLFIIPFVIASVVIGGIILLLQTIVSFTNFNLWITHMDLFDLTYLSRAHGLGEDAVVGFVNWILLIPFLMPLILFLAVSLLIVFLYNKKANFPSTKYNALFLAVILAFTPFTVVLAHENRYSGLFVDTSGPNVLRADDKNLYNNLTHKNAFFKKFGTYPMYFRHLLLGKKFGISRSINNSEFFDYFSTFVPFDGDNSYWGKLEGDNLIVVMMESIDEFLIHPKYTPTLYMLREQGINFTNFHAKSFTEAAESAVILGAHPASYNLFDWNDLGSTMNKRAEVLTELYKFSVPNQLKINGYQTANYFHLTWDDFYVRRDTHPLYGFDSVNLLSDVLEDFYQNPINEDFPYGETWDYPEEWFFMYVIDKILPRNKQFLSFISTINAHMPFGPDNYTPQSYRNSLIIEQQDFIGAVPNYAWEYYKHALSEAMLVDQGIEYLLQQLKERGIDQNTTIMFYTDHEAYGSGLSEILKEGMSGKRRIPAFIYSPKLQPKEITKFTTNYDLVPTIFWLLGIEVNSRFYWGNNAFNDKESIVVSKTGGIFNDKFFTWDGIEIEWKREDAADEDFREFQQRYVDYLYWGSYFDELFRGNYPEIMKYI